MDVQALRTDQQDISRDIVSLVKFKELVAQRSGLRLATMDDSKVERLLQDRLQVAGRSTLDEYCLFLEENSEASLREWKELDCDLTVQESFFFRDQGQFRLLRQWLLPELISRHRIDRRLKIWSAGCSSGEEPYSLAMLIDDLLPNRKKWEITVIGTDINKKAIDLAKEGMYNDWSLRRSPAQKEIERHFVVRRNGWSVKPALRNMVRFYCANLLGEELVHDVPLLFDIDLIICRNVFIYFTPEAIGRIQQRFLSVMSMGGYLMTGHGELLGVKQDGLRTCIFPESIVYQRGEARAADFSEKRQTLQPLSCTASQGKRDGSDSGNIRTPKPTKPSFSPPSSALETVAVPPTSLSEDRLKEAETLFLAKSYGQAVTQLKALIREQPDFFKAHCLLARVLANLGHDKEAEEVALRAVSLNDLSFVPYYLLAHLKEQQGDRGQAKFLLNRVLYLEPGFIGAYLDLAALYDAEGNGVKGDKMRRAAQERIQGKRGRREDKPYVEIRHVDLDEYLTAFGWDQETCRSMARNGQLACEGNR